MERNETLRLISVVLLTAAVLWGVFGFTYLFAGDKLLGGGFVIGAIVLVIADGMLIRSSRRR